MEKYALEPAKEYVKLMNASEENPVVRDALEAARQKVAMAMKTKG